MADTIHGVRLFSVRFSARLQGVYKIEEGGGGGGGGPRMCVGGILMKQQLLAGASLLVITLSSRIAIFVDVFV